MIEFINDVWIYICDSISERLPSYFNGECAGFVFFATFIVGGIILGEDFLALFYNYLIKPLLSIGEGFFVYWFVTGQLEERDRFGLIMIPIEIFLYVYFDVIKEEHKCDSYLDCPTGIYPYLWICRKIKKFIIFVVEGIDNIIHKNLYKNENPSIECDDNILNNDLNFRLNLDIESDFFDDENIR